MRGQRTLLRAASLAAAAAGAVLAAPARAAEPGAPPAPPLWAHHEFTRRFTVERACNVPTLPPPRANLPKDVMPPPEAAELVLPGRFGGPEDNPSIRLTGPKGGAVPAALRFDETRRRWVLAYPAKHERVVLYFAPDGRVEGEQRPYEFERRGVRLVTYRLTGTDDQRRQIMLSEVVAEARKGLEIYGSGPREVIDDAENPFGSNDNYLAVYQGWLYAGAAGWYRLALDADDAAFLYVDGFMAVSFGGRPHRMSGNWQRQKYLKLDKGFHHVTVYGRERVGAQGVRLAWSGPEQKGWRAPFKIIPARSFPGTVPARIVGTEARPDTDLVDFASLPLEQFLVNGSTRAARIELRALGARGRCLWEVGGRPPVAIGAEHPVKGYIAVGEEVPVRLRTSSGGRVGKVFVPEWPDPHELTVGLRFTELSPFIAEGEALVIGLEIVNSSPRPLRLLLDSSLPGSRPKRFDLGRKVRDERRRDPDRVRQTSLRALPEHLGHRARVKVLLGLGGVPVITETIRVLDSRKKWPLLAATMDGLRTAGGERVVVRAPREREADYRRWAPLRGLAGALGARAKGTVLYGDDLSLPGAGAGLAAALEAAGAAGAGPIRGVAFAESEVPSFGAVAGADSAAAGDETAFVVSLGRGEVSVQTPVHVAARALDIVIDRLRLGGAKSIVVVGPVPEVARMRLSARYNRAASKVAAEHHVGYVDLHGLLASGSGWRKNFAPRGDGSAPAAGAATGITAPYPTPEALAAVARAIAGKLK